MPVPQERLIALIAIAERGQDLRASLVAQLDRALDAHASGELTLTELALLWQEAKTGTELPPRMLITLERESDHFRRTAQRNERNRAATKAWRDRTQGGKVPLGSLSLQQIWDQNQLALEAEAKARARPIQDLPSGDMDPETDPADLV